MEQVEQYRRCVKDVIREYACLLPSTDDVQVELIYDEELDHYELMQSGWNGSYRVHGPVLHIDIRDGKIWIQHDGTEEGVANDLLAAGIPKEHIVLAFKPPHRRQHTEFAVT